MVIQASRASKHYVFSLQSDFLSHHVLTKGGYKREIEREREKEKRFKIKYKYSTALMNRQADRQTDRDGHAIHTQC